MCLPMLLRGTITAMFHSALSMPEMSVILIRQLPRIGGERARQGEDAA